MTTTSFHKSNLGSFGEGLTCDLDGYVHLTAEGWRSAPMDWGTESPNDCDSDEEREAKEEYMDERCEELAAESRRAVAQAEAGLAEWQSR